MRNDINNYMHFERIEGAKIMITREVVIRATVAIVCDIIM